MRLQATSPRGRGHAWSFLVLALCSMFTAGNAGFLFGEDDICVFEGLCTSLFSRMFGKGDDKDLTKMIFGSALSRSDRVDKIRFTYLTPEMSHPTSTGLMKAKVQNMTVSTEPKNCPLMDLDSKYRTVDGTCNNPFNLGSAPRQLRRYIPSKYADGKGMPRIYSKSGRLLPSGRVISRIIHPDVRTVTPFTIYVMQWGQIMDHDVVSTPLPIEDTRKLITCCSEDHSHVVPDADPECFPIMFRAEDNFLGNCMEFVRSMPVKDGFGNVQEPREHMNVVTGFLDLSIVYGSTNERLKEIRDDNGYGYLMNTTYDDYLPDNGVNDSCIRRGEANNCYLAGDERVNEHPAIALLHTVLVRLHNRIAHMLRYLRPMYSNEEVFQRARHINIAITQKIMYADWLPILLGKEVMMKKGLAVGPGIPRPDYSSFVDPTIPSEFGAAVFRFGHTLIPRSLPMDGKRELLRDLFFKPSLLKGRVEQLTDGLASAIDREDRTQFPDVFIVEEVTNHLFETEQGLGKGFDLIALNIQRARDHGIPPYNDFREYCGLKRIKSFDDPALGVSQKAMAAVYEHPDDIDLFAGSMSETPAFGGLVGETYSCLMSEVFHNMKYGDRFFYEIKGQKGSFMDDELDEIRKVTLSQVLCQTTAIKEIQLNAFFVPSKSNPKVSCEWLVRQGMHLDVFVRYW